MRPEFVDTIPEKIDKGILYISIRYGTAVHMCACGCGREVVTPINPTGWRLLYDGERVSLFPSIGNWQSPCKSHYWISDSQIQWAARWSQSRIDSAREQERKQTQDWYSNKETPKQSLHTGDSSADAHLNFDLWIKFMKLRVDGESESNEPDAKPHPR